MTKRDKRPMESGTSSHEFLERKGNSIDEGDLSEGERRRGGQDVEQ